MKKIIFYTLVLFTPLLASQTNVDEASVYTDRSVHLIFEQGVFSVESDNVKFDIPSHNVRGSVKGLSNDVIENLLKSGDVYFKLDCENKTLDSNLRMRGGMKDGYNTMYVGDGSAAANLNSIWNNPHPSLRPLNSTQAAECRQQICDSCCNTMWKKVLWGIAIIGAIAVPLILKAELPTPTPSPM